MSIVSAVSEVAEALAVWLNPEKKERIVLLRAIESAAELLKILRKEGRYKNFTEKQLKEYEIHFQKRFDAWRDGTS